MTLARRYIEYHVAQGEGEQQLHHVPIASVMYFTPERGPLTTSVDPLSVMRFSLSSYQYDGMTMQRYR
jgi:hypothetical protein